MAIRIQIEAQCVVPAAQIRILLYKPCGDRIVHAGVQVVEPCLRIVLIAGIKDVARRGSRLIEDIAERVVVVGRGDRSVRGKECRDIGVAVVEIEERILAEGAGDQVQTIDIPARLVAESVKFQHNFVVLIEEPPLILFPISENTASTIKCIYLSVTSY